MPREVSLFGVLIPTLLPLFLASLLLQGLLDWVLGHAGVYRRLLHPALVRLCLLVCIFSALTMGLYQ
ncbi:MULTISPECIES: DUF1656 domain-containing protein [Telluria group]|uniref:DUF1656 domain-containing protein n=1 Tax=Pseudoduganella violacea TaxID=1715466 RepID=A0A7W5FUB1_9BURK|nr:MULTISPECIES: DUF1656 domain-containing protein [Telluria group]AKU22069.1 hypothetical protein ACZ75_11940 [Massilia sp. NR 4-1]MBB3119557.1 hypothetical protein [Pseudoduganella violacea]NVE00049.1 DUF1656 domain-containing protein [Massilia sp. BJB1822]UMR33194.1 DUF1656 domain-containing protein [Massilia sp. MB5]UTY55825.1 DUF1656 domain-containing protein [Massilia sp. erpn]